jgi:hypothetical protein
MSLTFLSRFLQFREAGLNQCLEEAFRAPNRSSAGVTNGSGEGPSNRYRQLPSVGMRNGVRVAYAVELGTCALWPCRLGAASSFPRPRHSRARARTEADRRPREPRAEPTAPHVRRPPGRSSKPPTFDPRLEKDDCARNVVLRRWVPTHRMAPTPPRKCLGNSGLCGASDFRLARWMLLVALPAASRPWATGVARPLATGLQMWWLCFSA